MGDASTPAKEHILCLLPLPEDHKITDTIRKNHPSAKFTYLLAPQGKEQLQVPDEIWESTTVLLTLGTFPPDVNKAKNLKLVQLFSAGSDAVIKTPIWTDTKIPISNASGVHGPQISEWAIMQILLNSHRAKLLLDMQRRHVWGKIEEVGWVTDGVGQQLGVLGYGAIGRQTGRICTAMGMDVIAYTASPRSTPESKKYAGYTVPGTGDPDGTLPSAWYSGLDKASLHNFLSQDIDILLISVPLTKETRHFLAAEEFAILGKKRNAFIINIARGAIIKTEDLITALKKSKEDGGLRGAALDVTDPEPLPADSELWDMKNVAVTPHCSGLGTAYTDRAFQILDINLGRIEEGKPLLNVVSREKGY